MSAAVAQDSDELEALFDSIVEQNEGAVAARPAQRETEAASAPALALAATEGDLRDSSAMYQRIGQLTRQLHEALREVGAGQMFERAAREFPDAKNRLSYVARLTEQAAERTLNAVEIAQGRQHELLEGANDVSAGWEQFFTKEMSLAEFTALAHRTRAFALRTQVSADGTQADLHEIMMAQDFQDLTGQVIQKLTKLVAEFESQLLRFLVEAMPEERQKELERDGDGLEGPVVDAGDRSDLVTNQAQADELLESLGF